MFFKKENDTDFIDICALLIHAAKIDENYTKKEEEIIKKTLLLIGAKKDQLNDIVEKGELIEKDSNQILNFTKKVKNMSEEDKIKIIEALWQIIYSNNEADIYETNLMRRLCWVYCILTIRLWEILKKKLKKENSE